MFSKNAYPAFGTLMSALFVLTSNLFAQTNTDECKDYVVEISIEKSELLTGKFVVEARVKGIQEEVSYNYFDSNGQWKTDDPRKSSLTLDPGKYYCILILDKKCKVRKDFEIRGI